MTLKTKHSSAPTQCLMVNAAATHNSSQCTSARLSRTEPLYFPNTISLFYRQAPSCQTQTFQALLVFCLQMKSYLILQVMILTWRLPNYWEKYVTRNNTLTTVAFAPPVTTKFLSKEFQTLLPVPIPTRLKWVVKQKCYGDHFKTSNRRKSHGNSEPSNSSQLSVLLLSPKAALKRTPLFRTKGITRESLLLPGKIQDSCCLLT